MHIECPGINHAFPEILSLFCEAPGTPPLAGIIQKHASRYGEVYRYDRPLSLVFLNPADTCLIHPIRKPNPFLHVYSALWMLAGRRDVASLAHYAARMKEFSDDGETFHAAYGYRWRHHFGGDQLETVIKHLQEDRYSRRAVLQMWDCRSDLQGFSHYQGNEIHTVPFSKDYPCNTQVYVQIYPIDLHDGEGSEDYLCINVCNRSNDIFWGLLGENYVQFSLLLEYLAARLAVKIGRYHHYTANAHYYTEHFSRDKVQLMLDWYDAPTIPDHLYGDVEYIPLITDLECFHRELDFILRPDCTTFDYKFRNAFLGLVAFPLLKVWDHHKHRDYGVYMEESLDSIEHPYWKYAAQLFISDIKHRYENRSRK